jgi:hypothetical protein
MIVSWIAWEYYLNLTQEGISHASVAKAGEVQMAGLGLAMESQTIALWASALPFLLSVFLMVRGAMLPQSEDKPAYGFKGIVTTAVVVAVAAVLMGVSLLSYLDFGPYMYALFAWMV